MRHGLLGTSFAGLASGPPACRPLLMPLRLSPRALRKHLLSGFFKSPWRPQCNQPSIRSWMMSGSPTGAQQPILELRPPRWCTDGPVTGVAQAHKAATA
jgi:hypothetical protein